MARGPIADETIFTVKILMTLGNVKAQTGFHVRDVGITNASPMVVAQAIEPWVQNSFATLLHTFDRVLGIDVIRYDTREGGGVSFDNLAGTQGGNDAAAVAPAFTMVNVSLKGELRARYGQGGMRWPVRYKPWVGETALTTAGATAYQGVLSAFDDLLVDAGLVSGIRAVNIHGPLPAEAPSGTNPGRPALPPSYYDVTTTRLNTAVRPLRSRTLGVGS